MVGLTDLSEPAWEIEQTLNAWLRDEKVPSTEMLDFLENAANAFLVWVTELEEQGTRPGGIRAALINGARKLRGDGGARRSAAENPPPKSEAGAAARVGPNRRRNPATRKNAR
jgi:chemotaxis protein histidine kinase CheA